MAEDGRGGGVWGRVPQVFRAKCSWGVEDESGVVEGEGMNNG
jgi:hypothetical protein